MKTPSICWLPSCSQPVTYWVVVIPDYMGSIIGFCRDHKPSLQSHAYSSMKVAKTR